MFCMCRSILITPVKSLPSSKQSADGGRGAGRRIWAYPVFPLQVPGGGVPGHRLPHSANRPHSRGSPVTIWGPGSCTFTLPRKGVPRKSVLHVQSHTHHSPSGAPLLEAIGRRGPGGGSPDLTPPRFSTAGSRRAGSRPPAPAFSDPRPSRRTSTAPPENTFAAGTPLWKCFSRPHPFDPASRTRPPSPILSPFCRIS